MAAEHAINARSIVTLVVFFVVNVLVLFPLHIPLPAAVGRLAAGARRWLLGDDEREEDGERDSGADAADIRDKDAPGDTPARRPAPKHFTFGLATAPVAGVFLLLASTCIPPAVVRRGIVGDMVRPYDIMALFLSFAYISLSLDCTGLLLFLALTVASRSPPRGRPLFASLYALFITLALGVGNDPIVLSGTPFVAYFTSHARIVPPTAFLFAQFQAANLASALLVSSNPTNLVLTSAFHLSFLSFSAWTALPTVAAAVALFPVLRLQFRSLIPPAIAKVPATPRAALTDLTGAVFTTTIFLASIVLLVALSAAGKLEGVQGVWSVTAPAAVLVLLRDCWHDFAQRGNSKAAALAPTEAIGRAADEEAPSGSESEGESKDVGKQFSLKSDPLPVFDDAASENHITTGVETRHAARRRIKSMVGHPRPVVMRRHGSGDSRALNIPPPPVKASPSPPSDSRPTLAPSPQPTSYPPRSLATPSQSSRPSRHPLAVLRRTFPTVSTIIARLPLPLLPFAFSMFILVEGLDHTGWVAVWARWWERWARASGAAGCVFLMSVLSVVGCNILGTNIGATVLLSRILVVWKAEVDPSKRALFGSILALAVGSNFGAYSLSFPASLAGLLWRDILAQKGLHVRARDFLRWNMLPLAVTLLVGGCVVGAEVCVMFRHGQ